MNHNCNSCTLWRQICGQFVLSCIAGGVYIPFPSLDTLAMLAAKLWQNTHTAVQWLLKRSCGHLPDLWKEASLAGTAFYSHRSNVLFSKHTYFHPQIKCTKGFIGFNLFMIPNLQNHRSVNYYCVETAVTPSVCAGFRTDAAVSWHRLLRRSISGCSVGYESFLVNLSLLCLHLFCVVMSKYLTVFHLNIV